MINLQLTENEKNNLIKDFNSKMSIVAIKRKYNLKCSNQKIYALIPPTKLEKKCQYCGINMVSKIGRTKNERIEYCANCGHRDLIYCACKNCRNESTKKTLLKLEESNKISVVKKEAMLSRWCDETTKTNLDNLDCTSKFILGSFLFHSDLTDESPQFSLEKHKFFPNDDDTINCINYLVDLNPNILVLVDDPIPDHYNDRGEMVKYDTETFKLNVKSPYISQLNEIYLGNFDFPELDKIRIWQMISLFELFEYLNFKLNEIKFPAVHPDRKAKDYFMFLINNFSVSQIIYIINKSIKEISPNILAGKYNSKKHATNAIIKYCLDYGNLLLSHPDWKRPQNPWPHNLTRSIASHFLFNYILKLDNYAIDSVACISNLIY